MMHSDGVIDLRHIQSNLVDISKESSMMMQVFTRVTKLWGGCGAQMAIGIAGTIAATIIAVQIVIAVQI